jgi:enoyl-CoA hydratase
VALMTLDDPDKRNMLSDELVGEILAGLDRIEADESVGAIVVTGAGRAFCAGANLGNLDRAGAAARQESPEGAEPEAAEGRNRPAAASDTGGSQQARNMRGIYEAFLRFSRSPLPTVAAVNGPAVGAGMNLALACDLRLAGRSARFDTRFLDLGLHPGGGHTWMLERAVGSQTAAAMVLFGQALTGEEAADRGLAWACLADEELVPTALSLAARAASGPRMLSRRIKATLHAVQALDDHDAAVDTELQAQLWSLGQPFFQERLAAIRRRVSSRP